MSIFQDVNDLKESLALLIKGLQTLHDELVQTKDKHNEFMNTVYKALEVHRNTADTQLKMWDDNLAALRSQFQLLEWKYQEHERQLHKPVLVTIPAPPTPTFEQQPQTHRPKVMKVKRPENDQEPRQPGSDR